VEIMNPRDEGLFGWFTVNFLLDNISDDLLDSFVSLDLGGGSTQVPSML
jgi:ectonucleoside triphosphate diphosphohydrolase 5/6